MPMTRREKLLHMTLPLVMVPGGCRWDMYINTMGVDSLWRLLRQMSKDATFHHLTIHHLAEEEAEEAAEEVPVQSLDLLYYIEML